MLDDPLLQAWVDPERVDAEGDDAQQEPLDPVAEQARRAAGEAESLTVDIGVLRLPPVGHHDCPRVADPEGQNRDDESGDPDAEPGSCTAIESEGEMWQAVRCSIRSRVRRDVGHSCPSKVWCAVKCLRALRAVDDLVDRGWKAL